MRRTVLFVGLMLFLAPLAGGSDLKGILNIVGSSYELGQDFMVEVTLDNTSTFGGGPLDTSLPTAVLTIPSGLSVQGWSIPGGSCSQAGNQLTCSYPAIAAGDTKTFTVTMQGAQLGTHEVTLWSYHSDFDPNTGNNADQDLVTITEPTAPVLEVFKTASLENLGLGELVTYTIVVRNTGTATATDVQVQDSLPDGLEFVSTSNCVHSLGVITCTASSLPPNTVAEYQVTVSTTKAGSITNSATATAAEIVVPTVAQETITVRKRADVSISKGMADRAIFGPGSQVFTLTISNNGPDDADNVVVTDNLPLDPKSTLPVFADPQLPQGCSGGQAVECQLGTIAAGQSVVVTFGAGFNPELFGSDPLTRPDIVSYTNTASVTTSSNDENAVNNQSSVSGKVLAPPGEGQNAPWTEWVNDPVNPASGEIADTFDPDLMLSGPVPVFFARNYASFMESQGVVESGLGPNWSHNLAWRVDIVDAFGTFAYRLVSPTGRVFVFEPDGQGTLVQQSALYAPMQLKQTAGGFLAADPRTGMVRSFDSEGRLLTERTASGAGLSLTWSGDELQSVTNGLGQTLSFTWAAGRIQTVSDGSRTVTYAYSSEGWLTGRQNAAGNNRTYRYASGFSVPLLEADVHEDGAARFTQTFDSRGRVTTQTDALGGVTTFSYAEGSTTVTDPLGRVRTWAFDAQGRMIGRTDAAGEVQFTYDATGRRASVTDRKGGVTRFAYDAFSGAPTSVTFADGTMQTATYATRVDQDGFTVVDLVSRTDEAGQTTTYTVDAMGNRTSESYPDGTSRTLVYNSRGQTTSVTVAGKGTSTYAYDGAGRLISVSDPDGQFHPFTWDAFGRLVGAGQPDGSVRFFNYDALDRLVGLVYEDGSSRTHTFDAVGRLVGVQDEAGNEALFVFDDMDQLVRQGDFLGAETTFAYDAVGQLISRTDRTGKSTFFGYDAVGNRISMTDPSGLVTTWTYDAEGFPTGTTFPGGATTTVASDTRGRLVSVQDASSAAVSFTRNANGDILSQSGPVGSLASYTLDEMGRVTAIQHDGGDVTLGYDTAGRLRSVQSAQGTTSWAADPAGRMTSRTDGLGRTTSYTYDGAGRMATITYPDGAATSFTHDSRGRLVQMTAPDASVTLNVDANGRIVQGSGLDLARDANGLIRSSNGITVERDAEGRITQLVYPQGAITYTHDAGGRLSSVQDWAGRTTTFTYDAAGRVATLERPNGTSAAYTYSSTGVLLSITESRDNAPFMTVDLERDAVARILQANYSGVLTPVQPPERDEPVQVDAAWQIDGFTWDERGRLLDDGRSTYTWDGLNRMTGWGSTAIDHDAFGMPTTIGSSDWTWNYATALPTAAIQDGDAAFIYTPAGELLYRIDAVSGEATFYHFDEMGSTRLISNEAGQVVSAYAWDPFGRTLGSWQDAGPDAQPFGWRGQQGTMRLDADLYHMRSRVYDAWTARFLSPDPIADVDPLHVNPYQYAANNPGIFTDPLGQRGNFATGIGVAGIYQTTVETLEALKDSGQTIRQLLNSGKLGSVVMHGENGLARAAKLGPNASGAISAIAETYSSGNVARGLSVGAVDVALTANPYMAVIVIVSDLTDVGVSLATGGEVQGLRIADIWRNGGRFVGSLATDLVLSPFSSDHDFGDSLSNLANDMYDQDGVPGVIFDAGASIYIALGNEDLKAVYDADAESEVIDRQARLQQLDRDYQQQRELREFFRPLQNN